MGATKIQQKGSNRQQRKSKVLYRTVSTRSEDGTYEMVLQRNDGKQEQVGKFLLPYDNQIVKDYATMKNMEEAFKKRCKAKDDLEDLPNKTEDSFYDIFFQQVDSALYEFYLPNGILIGAIAAPCDMKYGRDIQLIKEVCRQLAYRYGIK